MTMRDDEHMTTVVLKRREADDGALSVAIIVSGQVMEEVPCTTEEEVTRVMQDIVGMLAEVSGPQVQKRTDG